MNCQFMKYVNNQSLLDQSGTFLPQNLESELNKKEDELRQFFLMKQESTSNSNSNNNNPSQETRSSLANGHNPSNLDAHDDDVTGGLNASRHRLKPVATAASELPGNSSNIINNNNINDNNNNSEDHSSNSPRSFSPLNLSIDADDSQPDSSFGTIDSKVLNSFKVKHRLTTSLR